jgi:hypothetical protein
MVHTRSYTNLQNQQYFFYMGGCLYAVGGYSDDNGASVERYDEASNTWTAAVADMLEPRWLSRAVTIGAAAPAEEQDLFDILTAKATCERP